MPRRKKQNRRLWLIGPMWLIVAALVARGLWQAAIFRRSMMREARATAEISQNSPPATPDAAATPAESEPAPMTVAQAESAQMPGAPASDPADAWAAATTPAQPQDAAAGTPINDASPAAPIPANDPGDSVDTLLTQGDAALDDGELVDGRWALNTALSKMADNPRAAHLRQELAELNTGIFLGSSVIPDDPAAKFVMIEPGDSFLKLGRRYSIPADLVAAINPGLNPRNLKPLTGVKVVQGPFHLRIFKRAGRIDLYARDMYVRSFPGDVEEGNYLPLGTYRVSAGDKIQVGAKRWVGIERLGGAGPDPLEGWLYGSAGPRMEKGLDRASGVKIADADLAELYNVLVERKSLVRVEP